MSLRTFFFTFWSASAEISGPRCLETRALNLWLRLWAAWGLSLCSSSPVWLSIPRYSSLLARGVWSAGCAAPPFSGRSLARSPSCLACLFAVFLRSGVSVSECGQRDSRGRQRRGQTTDGGKERTERKIAAARRGQSTRTKSGETEGEGIFRFAAFCEVCKLLVIA